MKKKFTKERFYKRLEAQKLEAYELMIRIEQGVQLAKEIFNTQREAIEYGRIVAQNQASELFIHRPNGQIRDRDSYGKDPCPPKDTKF